MSRVIAAFTQFFDGSGSPLANGFLQFLVSQTNNTAKNTYSDSSEITPNSNPVQLDAEGRCPNVFGQGQYRVNLYDYNAVTKAPGQLIASFDPVSAEASTLSSGSNFEEWDVGTNYQVANIVTRNGYYYKSITANNLGQDPEVFNTDWEKIGFIGYYNPNQTYKADDVVVYNAEIYTSLLDANIGNQPDISPVWWNPVGSGTILISWEESGTTLRPKMPGYDLGAVGNEVGTAYINDLGQFTETPASAPTTDYQIANKKYVDDNDALKMAWQGDWAPGTYNTFDVVRDDNWTMIANTSTDERPAPQPSGDAQWLRDLFSPPAFSETSSNETVLYVGQRYNFTPAFIALGMRVWFPTAAAGLEYKIWAVYNPTGSYRIINLYPGDVIDSTDTDKWLEIPFGQIYVENNTLVDIIIILKAPTSLVDFTFEWNYSKSNGDPPAGSIYHQGGSAIDEIRVHEQDSGLVDRTVQLDNIGPGSTIAMDSTGAQWDVLESSKTGDVYSFVVDPGARSDNATSDFTFQYYGSSPINYVYNTNLYAADARIQGYFGNTYDPDNAAYINENGYGLDIELQSVIVSDDWDVVAQPTGTSTAGGGQVLGYWEESEAYFRPITTDVGYLGDSTHLIQGLYLGDSSPANFGASQDMTITHDGADGEIDLTTGGLNIATTGSEIITFNDELIYSANNGPLAGFRNKIINPKFDFWQYGTSQSATEQGYDSANRWYNFYSGATRTVAQVAFTPGQTDVPNEPEFFHRTTITTAGSATSDAVILQQRISDVRQFAGMPTALSFYSKANSSINIATDVVQTFGSGSTTSAVTAIAPTTHALTTSWQKFTVNIPVPSITGADIQSYNSSLRLYFIFSAGSDYDSQSNSLGLQTGIFDIANVQWEYGNYVTPFENRPKSIEEVMCERYAFIIDANESPTGLTYIGTGQAYTATQGLCAIRPMTGGLRNPTAIVTKPTGNLLCRVTGGTQTPSSLTPYFTAKGGYVLVNGLTGLTAGSAILIGVTNSAKFIMSMEI